MADAPFDSLVYIVRNGSGPYAPVVLACGHDGSEMPEGVPAREPYFGAGWIYPTFSVQRDVKTGVLAAGIAEKLYATLGYSPILIQANFSRQIVDVNRQRLFAYKSRKAAPYWTAYHKALSAAVKDVRPGLLLDIHGTSVVDAELYLGTCGGTTATEETLTTFSSALTGMGYAVTLNHPRLSGGYTVAAHGAANGGLEAIQIEVAKPLRVNDSRREKLAQDLADVVKQVLAANGFVCG